MKDQFVSSVKAGKVGKFSGEGLRPESRSMADHYCPYQGPPLGHYPSTYPSP